MEWIFFVFKMWRMNSISRTYFALQIIERVARLQFAHKGKVKAAKSTNEEVEDPKQYLRRQFLS